MRSISIVQNLSILMKSKFKVGDRVLVRLDLSGESVIGHSYPPFVGIINSIGPRYVGVQSDSDLFQLCYEDELTLIPSKATKEQIEALTHILQ